MALRSSRLVFGVGGVDAPAVELAGDPLVILLRGVPAQRQAEAVLTGPLAVARSPGLQPAFVSSGTIFGSERRRGRLPGFGPARERERNHTDND